MLLIISLLTSFTLALQWCIIRGMSANQHRSASWHRLAPSALSPCRHTVDLQNDNLQVTVASQTLPQGEETSL